MAMIFPGMDPYFEDPQIWPSVHSRMVVYIADHLQPALRPRYIATVEERVYVEGPDREIVPDVWLKYNRASSGSREEAAVAVADDQPVVVRVPALEVHESYIAILDRQSGQSIVTVIEVVSPANKYPGAGRDSYVDKQKEVRGSQTHLVEIDLLRAGKHVLAAAEWAIRGRGAYDYLISVNRARGLRDEFELYPRRLRDRLPRLRIPLAEGDPDVTLDLQAVLAQTYDAGSYADRLRYDAPCTPPLAGDDQAWASEQIAQSRR